MACSISTYPLSSLVTTNPYIGGPSYYPSFFRYPMNSSVPSSTSPRQPGRRFSASGPQPIINTPNNNVYSTQGWPAHSLSPPISPTQRHEQMWSPQPNMRYPISTPPQSFSSYPEAASQPSPQYTKSHTRSYSGESRSYRRHTQQSLSQSYFPPISFPKKGRSSSPIAANIYSGSSTSSSSPPSSPIPFSDAIAPVHPIYAGLPRTESGLIPIPIGHVFSRGEIVMTRTTRRLMKTSSTGRLTARHPCLILQVTESHVRVLQMTSHVHLTVDQVRVVGAQLQHWLAREDPNHQDPFNRPGLRTSPPSDRAGYIWVGDGGEWVPIENVKYLTGTRVDEHEVRRLEGLTIEHATTCPFQPHTESFMQ